MSKRDYYEVLGAAKDASAQDLKKAYRRLAMKSGPQPSLVVIPPQERFAPLMKFLNVPTSVGIFHHEVLGDHENALKFYKKALSISPNFDELLEAVS